MIKHLYNILLLLLAALKQPMASVVAASQGLACGGEALRSSDGRRQVCKGYMRAKIDRWRRVDNGGVEWGGGGGG